jgi:organic hydroperoxide reductase OsmC/OhrA
MHPLPHVYSIAAVANVDSDVVVGGEGLPPLTTTVPPQFGGPGGRWSPETLLAAAVVDCFMLTFQGVARAARLPWLSLACDVVGTLDRVDRHMAFTGFVIRARLRVPHGTSDVDARRVMTRADETCLIARSLRGGVRLEMEIDAERPEETAVAQSA